MTKGEWPHVLPQSCSPSARKAAGFPLRSCLGNTVHMDITHANEHYLCTLLLPSTWHGGGTYWQQHQSKVIQLDTPCTNCPMPWELETSSDARLPGALPISNCLLLEPSSVGSLSFLWGESGGDTLPHFPKLPSAGATLLPQHPLWHTVFGLLCDCVHFLYLILNSWEKDNTRDQFAAGPDSDGGYEEPQKPTHRSQLWWHPTTLPFPCSGTHPFWACMLHLAKKCGPVCVTLSYWGGTLQGGRGCNTTKGI